MESQKPKAWSHPEQVKHTAGQEHIKVEEDSVFNNTLHDIDNFLNDIWSNADLDPPSPNVENTAIRTGDNEHQMNPQTANVQLELGNMNRKSFAVKEEKIAEGNASCIPVNNKSANQSAGGSGRQKIVMKGETVAEESNLCNASGSNRKKIVMEEETVTEECNICALLSKQNASQSASAANRENFVMKQEIVAEGSNLCTLVQNANQSANDLGRENFVVKQEIVAGGSNLCTTPVNPQSANQKSVGGPSLLTVDRAEIRRRRMLRNRASAARSRARSLVRLRSLESEVKQCKEENAMLRQKKPRASGLGNEQAPPRTGRKVRRCKSCCW